MNCHIIGWLSILWKIWAVIVFGTAIILIFKTRSVVAFLSFIAVQIGRIIKGVIIYTLIMLFLGVFLISGVVIMGELQFSPTRGFNNPIVQTAVIIGTPVSDITDCNIYQYIQYREQKLSQMKYILQDTSSIDNTATIPFSTTESYKVTNKPNNQLGSGIITLTKNIPYIIPTKYTKILPYEIVKLLASATTVENATLTIDGKTLSVSRELLLKTAAKEQHFINLYFASLMFYDGLNIGMLVLVIIIVNAFSYSAKSLWGVSGKTSTANKDSNV